MTAISISFVFFLRLMSVLISSHRHIVVCVHSWPLFVNMLPDKKTDSNIIIEPYPLYLYVFTNGTTSTRHPKGKRNDFGWSVKLPKLFQIREVSPKRPPRVTIKNRTNNGRPCFVESHCSLENRESLRRTSRTISSIRLSTSECGRWRGSFRRNVCDNGPWSQTWSFLYQNHIDIAEGSSSCR